MGQAAQTLAQDQVPTFRYNPDWPKQLPNGWTTGNIGAMYMGKDDHLWIAQRPNTVTARLETALLDGIGDCCTPAPPIIEYDPQGRVVQAWGAIHGTDPASQGVPPTSVAKQVLIGKQVSGPYAEGMWPSAEHGIYVDYKNNVWLTNQQAPSQLVKFTHDGKFIKRFGTEEGKSNSDTANFAGPTGVWVNPQTNEAFISDGYRNRRIIVLDADTGAFKRMWGAYGKPPKDPQQEGDERDTDQFSVVHCLRADNAGNLYVCDRTNSRIQVFKQDGTFIRELYIGTAGPVAANKGAKPGPGTAWDVAFSPDMQQRFMYVLDAVSKKVMIYRRSDFKYLGSFGHGGRQGGQFLTPHALVTDSQGNLYVGESLTGNRVQRFDFTGLRRVPANPTLPN